MLVRVRVCPESRLRVYVACLVEFIYPDEPPPCRTGPVEDFAIVECTVARRSQGPMVPLGEVECYCRLRTHMSSFNKALRTPKWRRNKLHGAQGLGSTIECVWSRAVRCLYLDVRGETGGYAAGVIRMAELVRL